MLDLQFNGFLVSHLLNWFEGKIQLKNRYRYYSDDQNNISQLIEALDDRQSGTIDFVLKENTYTLKYIEINNIKLIYIDDLDMSDSFISTLRDTLSSDDKEFDNCALLILHKSRLDTLINSAIDLSKPNCPLNIDSVQKELNELIKRKKTNENIFSYLLNDQTNILKEEASSVFGYEVIYSSISNGKIDFKAMELFEDQGIYDIENNDSEKIGKRLSENKKRYFDIKYNITNFPNELTIKLSDYSEDFLKSNITIDKWKDVPYEKLTKDIENNKSAQIKFVGSEKEIFEKGLCYLRSDGTSASASRNQNIIIQTDENKISLYLKFKGRGIKDESFIVKDNKTLKSYSVSKTLGGVLLEFEHDHIEPLFFTINHNVEKNSEKYNFKVLVLSKDSFNFESIQHNFILKPKDEKVILQLDEFNLRFNYDISSSIDLIEEEQVININSYGVIGLEEYYNSNDEVKFKITNGKQTLSFFAEGAKESEKISIPFIFNQNTRDKLFGKNNNIEFNKVKNKAIFQNREFQLVAERLVYIKLEQDFIDRELFSIFSDKELTINNLEKIDSQIAISYSNLLKYFKENRTTPSLASWNNELITITNEFIKNYMNYMTNLQDNSPLNNDVKQLFKLGMIEKDNTMYLTPFSPLILSYIQELVEKASNDKTESYANISKVTLERLNPKGLFPYLFIDNDSYAFSKIVKDNSLWLEFIPNEENEFSYIEKLTYGKIKEFTESFEVLFENKPDAPLIINSINNNENYELFDGIIKYYKENIKTPIKIIVNIYNEDYQETAFDIFSDIDKQEEVKNKFKKIRKDDDTLIDILRTHLIYSKHKTNDEKQGYCHLSFFKNNEKVVLENRTLSQSKSGLVANGLISGESAQKDGEYYYSGFGLKNINCNTPLINIARLYNSMQRAVFKDGTNYEKNKTLSLMISENFKSLLKDSYDNSLWTVIIDPKVTLEFFDNEENLILIHYSDQYSSSANYDAVTVTSKKDLYSSVLFPELEKDQKDNIVKQFNAFNGEWLISMITAPETIKKEREGIISAYKYMTSLVDTEGIVWVPLSIAEIIRVSGNVGLAMGESDFSRYNLSKKEGKEELSKGAISDDILLVGFTNEGMVLYPVEVKSGVDQINKAIKQADSLHTFFYEHIFNGESLEVQLFKGLFIRQIFMQVEKYELYKIFDKDYFEPLHNQRETLLRGEYNLVELENYSKASVVSFLSSYYDTSMKVTEDNILDIRLPYEIQKSMIHKSYDAIKKQIHQDSDNFGTNHKFILTSNNSKVIIHQKNETNDIEEDDEEAILIEKEQILEEKSEETTIKHNIATDPIEIKFGEDNLTKANIFWHPANTTENQNTCTGIIGRSGTGKTQFTKSLITQLVQQSKNNIDSKQIDILIFDYKKDYVKEDFVKATNATVLDLEKLPVNPLELFGDTPKLPTHTGRTLTTTLSKAFNLGNVQRNTLKNIIQEAYKQKGIDASDKSTWSLPAPTLYDIWDIYCESEDVKQDSLYAALDDLIDFEIFESDISKTKSLYDMINGVTVINLSGYDSNIQDLVVAILLDLFYVQMHKNGSSKVNGNTVQITKMILVDEADNFMSKDFDNLKKILKEGREFGVGTILSTQELTHFRTSEDDYASYIFTWIVHKVANLRIQDIQSIFNINNKTEAENLMSQIRELQKHYSFYVDGNKNIKKMRDLAFWELVKDYNDNN